MINFTMKNTHLSLLLFGLFLFAFSGCFTNSKSDSSDATISQKQPVKKWIALGNSITKHGVTPFWWGEWGMAATTSDKDYVHVLNKLLEDKYSNEISFKTINIGGWETDFKAFNKESLDKDLAGDEDLVVIRLGENVPSTEAAYASYEEELEALVLYLKSKSPKANYIMTGNFWTNKKKDTIQQKVAEKCNCTWVPLDHLDTPEYKSTMDAKVFGDDGEWHLISSGGEIAPGVAAHPSDKGMAAIADVIFKSIE